MSGGVGIDELKDAITKSVPAEEVLIWDDSDGCGSKFRAVIVAEKFQGMKLLERNRVVFASIEIYRPRIHAFSMRTWTKEEYDKKVAEGGQFF